MPVFIFPNYERYRGAGILIAGKIILCFYLQCFTRNAFYTKDRLDKCGGEGIILKMQDCQRRFNPEISLHCEKSTIFCTFRPAVAS